MLLLSLFVRNEFYYLRSLWPVYTPTSPKCCQGLKIDLGITVQSLYVENVGHWLFQIGVIYFNIGNGRGMKYVLYQLWNCGICNFHIKKNTSVYKIALKKPFIKIYIFDV